MKLRFAFNMLMFAVIVSAVTTSCGKVTNSARAQKWGSPFDPTGDCTIKESGGTLVITVPGGIHDMSGVREDRNRTAPRVLQEVEGDFTFSVKVTAEFDPPAQPGSNAFNGAGILVFDSDQNFLRLERNLWTTPDGRKVNYAPLFEYWYHNQMKSQEQGSPLPFFKGKSTFLRLERAGNQFTASVSDDGIEWEETNSTSAEFPTRVKVGVSAVNTAATQFTVQFSDLALVKAK
jgi:regulation of enolase protein 1 (concanavalin A-like superfamily)